VHAIRKHILDILKEREGATVADLAECLEMAPVSVRHHLDILQGDNLICVERLERKGNVGRPQQVYALTQEADQLFPDNFAALAAGLVRQLKRVLAPEAVEAAFQAMAQDFAGPLPTRLAGLSVEARLEAVTDFLNERGYLARWEVDEMSQDGGFLLHKSNCPYAGVSDEHNELCLMDQALINTLMGQGCRRIQSMAQDARCCTYRVGEVAADDITDATADDTTYGRGQVAIALVDLERADVGLGKLSSPQPGYLMADGGVR
jgi:predicted ArsR family transcriptional regulator